MSTRKVFSQIVGSKKHEAFLFGRLLRPSHVYTPNVCSSRFIFMKNSADANSHAEKVVQQIVQRLQDLGHTVFLTSDYTSQSPVPVLLENGLDEVEIVSLVTEQTEHWLSLKGKRLTSLLQLFASFQINPHNVILLLAREPKLFQLQEDSLMDRLSRLRNVFGLRSTNARDDSISFSKLLLNCPSVFFTDVEIYAETKSRLMNFFSSKELHFMLKNYPWVLTYDPDDLEMSFEYLHFVMGLEPRQIASCNWYKHPLNEIHTRFKFVSKSGNYVKPHPKKPILSKENIPIDKILDVSGKTFANLCHCSPEEFEAFRAIYLDEFSDIDHIKDEIQHNSRFKMAVYKRYENRTSKDEVEEDSAVESDADDDGRVEHPPIDDNPVLVNKQWIEGHKKRKRRRN